MQKQWNVNGKLNPSQNTNIDTKTDLENKCHVSTAQARKQSALECVYLRERTSLIVVCWKLHVSLIVCRLFRTPLQVSKCLLRPSSLLQHYIILQLGNKICLSRSYFPFSVGVPFLILLISGVLLSHHHYCGGFIGVTGKLWAWCLHFNFELWFTTIFSIIIHTGNHLSYYSSPPSYHLNHHHQKGHIAHRHSWVVVLKMVLQHSFCKN